MGQTLTHGVYLPDEGERNCYSGLAANWQILDNSVGTIAAHTAALAGKAPLVHTHTVSQITDFPAYGTTAGTICEGNDSRLSDARTPVAHTHTKSDVTDLLNSNFIPLANNSYDLGSSTYQWNNLYAKNYFYNGIAWGLDKANVWSAENTYTYSVALKQTNLEKGELPASNQTRRYRFLDKNNSDLGWLQHRVSTSGDSYLECLVANKFSNGQLSTQGNEIINSLVLGLSSDGSRYLKVLGDVYPDLPTRVCNLGTSTNKWKTLNGINPGALSLPKVDGWNSGTELTAAVGVDTTNWDMSGGTWNEMTNNIQDGWVFFAFQGCSTGDRALVRYYGTNARYLTMGFNAVGSSGGGYYLYVAFPMAKGSTVNIAFATSGSVMSKFIYPCMGNV